jgi:hypothetical protein
MIISFHFAKSTEMTGYPIGIKVRHDMKNHVMHVKCIHDLCTLPLDIPPYLHHILVIFMLLDDYWE